MSEDERITRLAGDGTQTESGGGFPLPDAVHEMLRNLPATTAEFTELLKNLPLLSMREARVHSVWKDNPWKGMAQDLAESLAESGILKHKDGKWKRGPSLKEGKPFVIVPGREGKNRQVTTVIYSESDEDHQRQLWLNEGAMKVTGGIHLIEKAGISGEKLRNYLEELLAAEEEDRDDSSDFDYEYDPGKIPGKQKRPKQPSVFPHGELKKHAITFLHDRRNAEITVEEGKAHLQEKAQEAGLTWNPSGSAGQAFDAAVEYGYAEKITGGKVYKYKWTAGQKSPEELERLIAEEIRTHSRKGHPGTGD